MIKELSVRGLKCFQTEQIIQLAKVNVLSGLNGRGKSTIVQALLLLSQSIDSAGSISNLKVSPKGRYVQLGDFNDILNRKTANHEIVFGIKTDDDDENDIKLVYQGNPNPLLTTFGKLKSFLVDGKEQMSSVGSPNGKEGAETRIVTSTSRKGLRQLQNVVYVSADRRGPADYVLKDDESDSSAVGSHGEYAVNALVRHPNELGKVKNALSEILHGATIKTETQKEFIRLYLDSNNDGQSFTPSNVGFGYSYVLPVIIAVLLAKEGSKVIVENPEAHLHPGAQSRLMRFMLNQAKNRDLQLFVETHSDHIINALRIAVKEREIDRRDAAVVFVDRREDGTPIVSQIKVDDYGSLSDYPDGFMEEWSLQMSSLV